MNALSDDAVLDEMLAETIRLAKESLLCDPWSAVRARAFELLRQEDAFQIDQPLRVIHGIGCTGQYRLKRPMEPAAAFSELPVPLLLDHDWELPIGIVYRLDLCPEGVRFEAILAHQGFPLWLGTTWRKLKQGRCCEVSVGTARQISSAFSNFEIHEVSLCSDMYSSLDPRARVHYVGEIDARSGEQTVHIDVRGDESRFRPMRSLPDANEASRFILIRRVV